MPGTHNSGRLRKTTQEHTRAGTYKPSRHGGRGDDLPPEQPPKPADLSPDAAAFWDQVVAWLVEHGQCQRIDAFALEAMCRLWACARVSLIAAEADPLDKDIRIAATSYAQRFESMASRFGMTPVDRARLTLKAAETTENPQGKERFFPKVVG